MSTDHHGLMSVDDIASRYTVEASAVQHIWMTGDWFLQSPTLLAAVVCNLLYTPNDSGLFPPIRADELQTVLMEMVKQDSRHQLSAKGELKEL